MKLNWSFQRGAREEGGGGIKNPVCGEGMDISWTYIS